MQCLKWFYRKGHKSRFSHSRNVLRELDMKMVGNFLCLWWWLVVFLQYCTFDITHYRYLRMWYLFVRDRTWGVNSVLLIHILYRFIYTYIKDGSLHIQNLKLLGLHIEYIYRQIFPYILDSDLKEYPPRQKDSLSYISHYTIHYIVLH